MKLVPNILTACNCIHIVYLVHLRASAVRNAMKCKKVERERNLKSIIIMWIGPILTNLVPIICTKVQTKDVWFYFIYRHILLHGLHTIPIILIVILHIKMLRRVNKNNHVKMKRMSVSSGSSSKAIIREQKTPTQMIKGVAITLVVCYLPCLSWWQYSMIVFRTVGGRGGSDTSAAEVNYD